MSFSGCRHSARTGVLGLLIGPLGLLASANLAAAPFRPGPLATASSGEVIILNLDRELLRLRFSTEVTSLWRVRPIEEAVDMTVARLDGAESIFVTMSSRFLANFPRLVRFSLSGEPNGEWKLPPWKGSFSGVAIDPVGHLAYVTNSETSEIYRLDLRRVGSSPVRLFRIRFAAALGAVVFDAKRQRLLVADSVEGVIYAVQIDGGKVSELVRGTGEPLALALDSSTDRLFIADSINERILVMGLGGKTTEAEVFSAFKEIEEPLGLAVGAEGTLWVGDHGAATVFLLSSEGKLLETFRW
jgi:DNA-binding beta-propeller fold protein YncE